MLSMNTVNTQSRTSNVYISTYNKLYGIYRIINASLQFLSLTFKRLSIRNNILACSWTTFSLFVTWFLKPKIFEWLGVTKSNYKYLVCKLLQLCIFVYIHGMCHFRHGLYVCAVFLKKCLLPYTFQF